MSPITNWDEYRFIEDPAVTPELMWPENDSSFTAKPLHWDMQDVLYCSDIHAPLHHIPTLRRIVAVAKKLRIRKLIIGGDFFDFASLSRYPKDGPVEPTQRGIDIGGEVLIRLLDTFDRIAMVPGNHDIRLNRAANASLDFSFLVWGALKGKTVDPARLDLSNYEYMLLGEEETGFAMGHPTFHSKAPGKIEAELAMKIRRNVISAHTHLAGMMHSPCGRFVGITPGCVTTSAAHWYTAKGAALSRHSEWVNGFVVIQKERARLMVDSAVDFKGEFGVD